MQVTITGSRGMIGGALAASLRADGHTVTGVTRSRPGADEVQWSPRDGRIDVDGLRGADAVVHLAGENIGFASWHPRDIIDARWTPETKRELRESRIEGTTLIARTLAAMDDGPRTLVSASAIGYYGDRGDEILTESSGPGDLFLSELCLDWERSADPAREAGLRVVHPRIGVVQTPQDGALQRSLPLFRVGLGGPFGSGRQWWSWVMLSDVVGVLRHALSNDDVVGPVNVTAPNPVTNGEWTKTLARVLGRPAVLPVPRFGPRLVLGEMADELIYTSARVLPEAVLATGYTFRYADLEAGLRSVL